MDQAVYFVNADIELSDLEKSIKEIHYDAEIVNIKEKHGYATQLNIYHNDDRTKWGYFTELTVEELLREDEEKEELKKMTFKTIFLLEYRYTLGPHVIELFKHLLSVYGGYLDSHGDLFRRYDLNNIESLINPGRY